MAFFDGPYYVDALMDSMSWTGTNGSPAVVTYSFIDSPYITGDPLSPEQQAAALSCMQLWANVANVTFVQDDSNQGADTNILFATEQLGGSTLGVTSYNVISNVIQYANIRIDIDETGFTPGNSGYLTIMHELGHALGLDHPGRYGGTTSPPFLPSNEDNSDNTVMSYFDGIYSHGSIFPQTPMIYDVAAIQFLYGANHNFHSTNDDYVMTSTSNVFTLWDGNGNDTIDASSYTLGAFIDLREGINNITHVGDTHMWIAFGANIENALGGSGNDTINGNALNNILTADGGLDSLLGAEGNDTLNGGAGADYLQGNMGSDTLLGGDDNDTIFGGKDNDWLEGQLGNDSLNGDLGNDTINGGDQNDFIFGGAGLDVINGNAGNDSIAGDADNDLLRGGQGNDTLNGGIGNDSIYGDKGNDTLIGSTGNDIFVFGIDSGVDVINDFVSGDQLWISSVIYNSTATVLAHSTVVSGNTIVDLGSGNQITLIGDSNLTASDILIF